jgi:hypothetical protein
MQMRYRAGRKHHEQAAVAHVAERGAQRLRILPCSAWPAECIHGQQHAAKLRDARQQLVGDEARIAPIALQLRDEVQPFETAIRMIRDDDRRAGARDPLQLAFVELESHLQELERLCRKVGRGSSLAAELAMNVREPLESEGALGQAL